MMMLRFVILIAVVVSTVECASQCSRLRHERSTHFHTYNGCGDGDEKCNLECEHDFRLEDRGMILADNTITLVCKDTKWVYSVDTNVEFPAPSRKNRKFNIPYCATAKKQDTCKRFNSGKLKQHGISSVVGNPCTDDTRYYYSEQRQNGQIRLEAANCEFHCLPKSHQLEVYGVRNPFKHIGIYCDKGSWVYFGANDGLVKFPASDRLLLKYSLPYCVDLEAQKRARIEQYTPAKPDIRAVPPKQTPVQIPVFERPRDTNARLAREEKQKAERKLADKQSFVDFLMTTKAGTKPEHHHLKIFKGCGEFAGECTLKCLKHAHLENGGIGEDSFTLVRDAKETWAYQRKTKYGVSRQYPQFSENFPECVPHCSGVPADVITNLETLLTIYPWNDQLINTLRSKQQSGFTKQWDQEYNFQINNTQKDYVDIKCQPSIFNQPGAPYHWTIDNVPVIPSEWYTYIIEHKNAKPVGDQKVSESSAVGDAKAEEVVNEMEIKSDVQQADHKKAKPVGDQKVSESSDSLSLFFVHLFFAVIVVLTIVMLGFTGYVIWG
eukprot:778118_1